MLIFIDLYYCNVPIIILLMIFQFRITIVKRQNKFLTAKVWLTSIINLDKMATSNNEAAQRPWASYGILKGPGIPAPTGQYTVGCIDIMTETGTLMILYYPTHSQHTANGYQYANAYPDAKYTKATGDRLFPTIVDKIAGQTSLCLIIVLIVNYRKWYILSHSNNG